MKDKKSWIHLGAKAKLSNPFLFKSLPWKGGSVLKTKEEKAEIISDLKDRFTRAKGAVVAEYSGLTVENLTELRVSFNKSDLDFTVVKNTLARKALEGTPTALIHDSLTGQVAVAMGYDDPVVLAKAVLDYAKSKEETFKIRMGLIEGKVCNLDQLKSVALLPGRDVLLGQLAGVMQAPTQKLAGLMANTITRFAYALEALKAQKAA